MKRMFSVVWIIPLLSLSFAVLKHVEITAGMSFSPSTLTVSVGDIVRWTNNHSFTHTATSTDTPVAWEDADITPGTTFEITFNNTGEFPYDCAYHSSMTGIITVSETVLNIDQLSLLSETFQLHSNYPNPFNPTTNIEYSLLENSVVELIIYNIEGRQIYTLIDDFKTAGLYSIKWDASSYPSGIYIVKMTSGEYVSTKKLMLIK